MELSHLNLKSIFVNNRAFHKFCFKLFDENIFFKKNYLIILQLCKLKYRKKTPASKHRSQDAARGVARES